MHYSSYFWVRGGECATLIGPSPNSLRPPLASEPYAITNRVNKLPYAIYIAVECKS
jgi:hypothetical protein